MYLHKLTIKNIRRIEEAELFFQYPDRVPGKGEPPLPGLDPDGKRSLGNVNLILGINGSGKTTVLKSAALSLISPVLQNSGYHPYSVVRRTARNEGQPLHASVTASVVLSDQDLTADYVHAGKVASMKARQHVLETRFERKATSDIIAGNTSGSGVWEAMYDRESPSFLIVGYGATRRVTSQASDPAQVEKRTMIRYMRVQSLFDEAYPLIPLASWLPALEHGNKGRWTQVVHSISKALGDDYEFAGEFADGEYQVVRAGIRLPMGALSDGYRAYIGWVGDMLYHICMGAPSGARLVDNCGIVLVDEIDLHLHPEWQRQVIPTLAKTFPCIQFIFTTHSPIVVGSVEWSNIHVLGEKGPEQSPHAVSGLSADQILLSPYFGLESTRSDRKLEELRALETKAQKAVKATTFKGAGVDDDEIALDAAMDYMRSLTLGTEAIAIAAAPPVTKTAKTPAKAGGRKKPTTVMQALGGATAKLVRAAKEMVGVKGRAKNVAKKSTTKTAQAKKAAPPARKIASKGSAKKTAKPARRAPLK